MRLAIGMLCLVFANALYAGDYVNRAEVKAFVEELATAEGFSREELFATFEQAEYKQSIIDAISRPAEKVLTWKEYQDIFLTSSRVEKGKEFIVANQETLAAAEEKYGVPPHVIAAIIGVETLYGQRKGSYRVIDALSTLAFDYPPRSSFFRRELKHFLLLAREENQSPTSPVGSYAGAMGYGQFIPSSYRHYAVDFDGDGLRDIWENRADAIGSVANYLARHGWKQGQPVALQTTLQVEDEAGVFGNVLLPSHSVSELNAMGLTKESGPVDMEVSPLRLEGKHGSEFWLGYKNFYVITRYNHSKLYAMAVYQLSERLKSQDVAHRI